MPDSRLPEDHTVTLAQWRADLDAKEDGAVTCPEEHCDRPVYLDGLCKRHRDLWVYRLTRDLPCEIPAPASLPTA